VTESVNKFNSARLSNRAGQAKYRVSCEDDNILLTDLVHWCRMDGWSHTMYYANSAVYRTFACYHCTILSCAVYLWLLEAARQALSVDLASMHSHYAFKSWEYIGQTPPASRAHSHS